MKPFSGSAAGVALSVAVGFQVVKARSSYNECQDVYAMTESVQQLLKSFEQLPEAEKRELASEIIRRSLTLGLPELSDEALLLAADQIFLGLDREESVHE